MLKRTELETAVEQILTEELEKIYATVPYVGHLAGEEGTLHEDYYLRHRVETIKRIRLTSKTDALALARMVDEDYDAARWWSRYVAQELDHDLLYLRDLQQHGYTADQVAAISPLPATTRMLAYLTEKIDSVGSIAAVAYSLAVEWNSERVSARVVEKAANQYSSAHTKGAKAHVGIDEEDDHYAMMLDVVHRLLAHQRDETVLFHLLRDISAFLGEYFRELHDLTVVKTERLLQVA